MTKKNILKELFGYLIAALIVWCCIITVVYSKKVFYSINISIGRCLNIIIPSLFAFMALSSIIIKSKLYLYITKPFYLLTKYILRIPNLLFFVFLLGNVSGYPVGAKLLVELKNNNIIDKKTAEIISCFCYSGGPAFFTGTIGLAVYKSNRVGILIFLSSLLSNFILCCIMCRLFKPECKQFRHGYKLSVDTITDSIVSTGKTLFIICTSIIFFSAVMSLLDVQGLFVFLKNTGLNENANTLIKGFFEISYLSELSSDSFTVIPIIAGLCSFGGICVLLQVKAIVGKSFSLRMFIISRIISAFLSGIICKILSRYFLGDAITTTNNKIVVSVVPNNILPSVCLIAMIFIITIGEKNSCSHTNENS